MESTLGFTINIKGTQAAIETATDVKLAISQINKELKDPSLSGQEVKQLEDELVRLKGTLGEVNRQQKLAVKEFERTSEGVSEYKRLSAEFVIARERAKNLQAEYVRLGKTFDDSVNEAIEEAKRLNDQLKEIDGNIGNFSRNVGNYPTTIAGAFGQSIPLLGRFQDGIGQIGDIVDKTGRRIATSFFVFAIINELVKGIQLIGEFSEEFRDLRGEISQLTGASGEELDGITVRVRAISQTFDQDYNEVLRAANTLSREFGISQEESLEKIATGLESGANLNNEFLDQLREYPTQFAQAGASADEFVSFLIKATEEGIYSDKGADLVKEFGLTIREQTKASRDALENAFGEQFTSNLFENINSGRITTIDALEEIAGQLNDTELTAEQTGRVLADVFKGAGEDAGLRFIKSLSTVEGSLEDVVDNFNEYQQAQREQRLAEEELARAQNEVAKQFDETSKSLSLFSTRVKTVFFDNIALILQFFEQLPATGQGLKAAFEEIGTDISNFFNRFLIDAEITFKRVSKLNPFGKTSEQLDEEIRKLELRRETFAKNGRSVGEAYREAFLAGLDEVEIRKAVASAGGSNSDSTGSGFAENETSEERDQLQRELDKLKDRQQKVLEQEQRAAVEREALLNQLNRQLVEVSIQNIDDLKAREQAQLKAKFDQRLQELADQEKQLITKIGEQDQQIIEAFGEGSEEIKRFREQSQKDLLAVQQRIQSIELEETERYREERIAINEKYDNLEAKQRAEALDRQLELLQDNLNREIEVLRSRRNSGELSENDFASRLAGLQQQQLLEPIKQIQNQIGVSRILGASDEEIAELEQKLQQAKDAYLKFQNDTIEGNQEVSESFKEIDQGLQLLNDGFKLVSDFITQSTEREIEALDKRVEAQTAFVDRLEEQASRATGSRRLQLERQLKDERKTLEQQTKQQERARSEQAKQEKAIATIQSIINTALAVTKALATGNAVAAVAAGVFGAAQTAIIQAQPLAEGGVVNGDIISNLQNTVTPVRLSDGKIVTARNIPVMANGDEILATVKRGEVVLNDRQQRLLGGAKTFASIGVPGFNEGGVIGSVIGAPNFQVQSGSTKGLEQVIDRLDKKTDAINARIDRMRAYVVSEDVVSDIQEGENLIIQATFEQ